MVRSRQRQLTPKIWSGLAGGVCHAGDLERSRSRRHQRKNHWRNHIGMKSHHIRSVVVARAAALEGTMLVEIAAALQEMTTVEESPRDIGAALYCHYPSG
ncbi:unnamed protein product [Cuscuta epithymum]|uniref:Uncharacterized protein n=1 Tax=Cuscuta epithymum TaxID=186058 RepID=A0AAV0FDB0_9ASTE|nr:unnamed protein product [Cuscuta epithymum]